MRESVRQSWSDVSFGSAFDGTATLLSFPPLPDPRGGAMADSREQWTLSETRRLRRAAEETSRRSAELLAECDEARVVRERTRTRSETTRNAGSRRAIEPGRPLRRAKLR